MESYKRKIINYCIYCRDPIYEGDDFEVDKKTGDFYHRECFVQMNTVDDSLEYEEDD